MEMNTVVDQGKLGADRVVGTLQALPPMARLRRRRSRTDRVVETLQGLPPAARVVLIAAATGVLVGLAFVARKQLFAATADVSEKAADTVEDAAGDLAEAAQERSEAAGD